MIRKMIQTFTSAAMSTSIALAVPVGVTAVSSLTVIPEAQAFGFKSIKNAAKKTKRVVKRKYKKTKDFVTAKNCPGGTWVNGYSGLCGFSVDPYAAVANNIPRFPKGRIGDLPNIHDHRQKPPSGVAITFNPLRWR